MYKLPQAVIDEVMASTTSLAAGLKLLAKEYRVLEDLRKSQAESRAERQASVAHEGKPCIHCHTPYPSVFMCPARVSELVRIVSELDKTADGVPITPKTALWQADPLINEGRPWPCSPKWIFYRAPGKAVYSTKEAAREAEL